MDLHKLSSKTYLRVLDVAGQALADAGRGAARVAAARRAQRLALVGPRRAAREARLARALVGRRAVRVDAAAPARGHAPAEQVLDEAGQALAHARRRAVAPEAGAGLAVWRAQSAALDGAVALRARARAHAAARALLEDREAREAVH